MQKIFDGVKPIEVAREFEVSSAETNKGIAQASLETQCPVIMGVLTADTVEQAIERAGTKGGNKGWDAALTAIEMASLMEAISH